MIGGTFESDHDDFDSQDQSEALDEANTVGDGDQGEVRTFADADERGTFEDLRHEAIRVSVFGVECLCLDLAPLIRVKRAAGRPKDLEAIAELERLLSLREPPP